MTVSEENSTPVSSTYLRIPNAEAELRLLNRLQQHGTRPVPLQHEAKELGQDRRADCVRIQLANARYHDGPRDTAGISIHIAVYRALCS